MWNLQIPRSHSDVFSVTNGKYKELVSLWKKDSYSSFYGVIFKVPVSNALLLLVLILKFEDY